MVEKFVEEERVEDPDLIQRLELGMNGLKNKLISKDIIKQHMEMMKVMISLMMEMIDL